MVALEFTSVAGSLSLTESMQQEFSLMGRRRGLESTMQFEITSTAGLPSLRLVATEFDAHEEETGAEKSAAVVCKLLAESNAAESSQYGGRLAAGALSGPASRSRFKS